MLRGHPVRQWQHRRIFSRGTEGGSRSTHIDRVGGMIWPMAVGTVYRKASWTIPSDVLDSVHRRVPRGQVSAYVTEALRRQLELDNLASLVAEMEAEGGPVDEANVAWYMEEMR